YKFLSIGIVVFEEADLSPLGQCNSPDSTETHGEEKTYKKEGKKCHFIAKANHHELPPYWTCFSSSLGNSESSGVSNSTSANCQIDVNDTAPSKRSTPLLVMPE
ncbi:hypothetical protein CEXT_177961, partial [Caerostris extrusa]